MIYKINSKNAFNQEVQNLVISSYTFLEAITLLMEKYNLDNENIISLLDEPIKERLKVESIENNYFKSNLKVKKLKFKK